MHKLSCMVGRGGYDLGQIMEAAETVYPSLTEVNARYRGLTAREFAFVLAVASGEDGKTAARLAGYSPNSEHGPAVQANRLLKRQDIQDAITQHRELVLRRTLRAMVENSATVGERRHLLSRIARRTKTQPGSSIKAIDVLNKMDGLYVERHEHQVVSPKPVIHEHQAVAQPEPER